MNQKMETDLPGLLARLAGGTMFVCFLLPSVRRTLDNLGFFASGLCFLVFVSLLGFGIYRLIFRQGTDIAENPFLIPKSAEPSGGMPETAPEAHAKGALNLLEPAVRRRFPWRHDVADPS
jgi:hypothetical protein